MVKSEARVRAKMEQRIATAGSELIAGMEDADDPLDIIAADISNKEKKLVAGVSEGVRKGNYKRGIEKARKRNAWKTSKDRAGRHYEERAPEIVERSMESFGWRMEAIAAAKASIKDMPTTTTEQRVAKSAAYQLAVSKEFEKRRPS